MPDRIATRLAWVALLLFAPSTVRAELHGGVEIGAKGVKATVIDVTTIEAGYDVQILLAGTKNTTLSEKVSDSGEPDAAALKATVAAVKAFLAEMEGKHKVPKENIYVVASSGIFASIEKDKKAVASGLKTVGAAVHEATGRQMDSITPEQEAELSIAGIVPRKFRGDSMLFDIGSGNTKGGYYEDGKYTTFAVPYGSVTFTTMAKKKFADEPFAKAAALAAKEVLAPELAASMKDKPGLLKRERVYLSGGAVWALATLVKPGDRGSFTALSAEDIEGYRKSLASAKEYPKVDLDAIKDADVRAAAEKEVARVKKAFTPEQLLSGAEILGVASKELKLDGGKRKAYFARNAYLGWILAYVARK